MSKVRCVPSRLRRLIIDPKSEPVFYIRRRAWLLAAAGLIVSSATLLGQSRLAERDPSTRSGPPRAQSRGDIEGVWAFATLTPLERPEELANKPFLGDAEAAEYVRQTIQRGDRDRRDGGAAVDVGRAVNDHWFDRGSDLAELDGKKLTSLIADPPDGRLPPLTATARQKASARAAIARERPADGPENRSLQERCLAFNAGPPILSGPYNNFVKIQQFPNHVLVFTEMIHDARVIPLDGRPHAPAPVGLWLGDSRGRWEGNTLIVDTTNFNGKVGFRGAGEHMHLVERFTRVGADTLLYEFTVEDPTVFTRPWTARLPMQKSDARIFEYACHEANYALVDILRGARYQERMTKP